MATKTDHLMILRTCTQINLFNHFRASAFITNSSNGNLYGVDEVQTLSNSCGFNENVL